MSPTVSTLKKATYSKRQRRAGDAGVLEGSRLRSWAARVLLRGVFWKSRHHAGRPMMPNSSASKRPELAPASIQETRLHFRPYGTRPQTPEEGVPQGLVI